MNNLPLQPLVWFELENTNRLICEVVTPICEYSVWKDVDSVAYSVLYYNRHTEAPTKEATGFATIDEAKAWAWSHYNEKMQPYVKPDSIADYFYKFKKWGLDRGIIQNGDTLAQGLKLVSEIGELADNLAKDRCIKDDIGDCMVVLTMLANMTDTPIEDCLSQAWGDIKDRKGFMNENGVFIKDGDIEEKL